MADKDSKTAQHVRVSFGRPVTEEDLKALQSTAGVLEASLSPIDQDQDHVHTLEQ